MFGLENNKDTILEVEFPSSARVIKLEVEFPSSARVIIPELVPSSSRVIILELVPSSARFIILELVPSSARVDRIPYNQVLQGVWMKLISSYKVNMRLLVL